MIKILRITLLSLGAGILFSLHADGAAQEPASPPTAVSQADWETYLKVQAIIDKNSKISFKRMQESRVEDANNTPEELQAKVYTPEDIDVYLKAEKAVHDAQQRRDDLTSHPYLGPRQFPWLSLRRSYRDVLTMEDPSLQVEDPKKPGQDTFDDLDGAIFSYSRDVKKRTDTWSAEGALLAPFSFTLHPGLSTGDPWTATRFGFIPSVSYHRISTNGPPTDEIDQLTYRIGLFLKLESGTAFKALTFRGYGTYLTDSQNHSSIPAAEFEVEPQIDLGKAFDNRVRLGYRTILVPKPEAWQKDIHDTALIAYQLRAILHGEYVSVRDPGAMLLEDQDTFRMGPVVQLDLKPFIFPRLNLSARYSYLPVLSGARGNENDGLFSASCEWVLVKDEEKRQKLALNISYLNGGLDLTEQKAETVIVGLSATF